MSRFAYLIARKYDNQTETYLQARGGWCKDRTDAKRHTYRTDADQQIRAIEQYAASQGLQAQGRLVVIMETVKDGFVSYRVLDQ